MSLKEKMAAAILTEPGVQFGDLYEAVATLTVGMFIKSDFGDQRERMKAFDDYCNDVREGIEKEVTAGNAVCQSEGDA